MLSSARVWLAHLALELLARRVEAGPLWPAEEAQVLELLLGLVRHLALLHEEVARLPRAPLAQLNLRVVQLPCLLVLPVDLLVTNMTIKSN